MTTVPIPWTLTAERKPAWRAACLAYREKRHAGYGDLEAFRVAVTALQAVWPLPDRQAAIEARIAITYASKRHLGHLAWMWRGVGGTGRG
jgi:hypothetical protein